MPTRSKGAKMHRKEEEVMAEATFAREKEAVERQLQEEGVAVLAESGVGWFPPLELQFTLYLLVTLVWKVREPKRMELPQKP
jgi:hypothetical protein